MMMQKYFLFAMMGAWLTTAEAIAEAPATIIASTQHTTQRTEQIVEKAIGKFKNNGGVEAQFSLSIVGDGKKQTTTHGMVQIEGDCFAMVMPHIVVWFDGKTQWTMQPGSDEVNVTHPTPDELRSINPYLLIETCRKNYTNTHRTCTIQGKAGYEIVCKAKGKERMQEVHLFVDKEKYQIRRIEVKDEQGWIYFDISKYNDGKKWNKAHFAFSPKDYPDVEVIDLR